MIKAFTVLCSLLMISTAFAEFYEFDNYIEYDPSPSISLPYPYQAIEPAAPVYKKKPKIYVPPPTEVVEVVQPSFISTAVVCVFNAVISTVVFLIAKIPGLIIGIIGALGLCKLTSLCNSQVTIYEAQSELRSLATPERISSAVDFVKDALRKYQEMQR